MPMPTNAMDARAVVDAPELPRGAAWLWRVLDPEEHEDVQEIPARDLEGVAEEIRRRHEFDRYPLQADVTVWCPRTGQLAAVYRLEGDGTAAPTLRRLNLG